VNEDFFVSDLMANYAEMKRFGMDNKEEKYFLNPKMAHPSLSAN